MFFIKGLKVIRIQNKRIKMTSEPGHFLNKKYLISEFYLNGSEN